MTADPNLLAALKNAVISSQMLGVFPFTIEADRIRLSVIRAMHSSFMTLLTIAYVLMTFLDFKKDAKNTHFQWDVVMVRIGIINVTSAGTIVAMLFSGVRLNSFVDACTRSLEVTSAYFRPTLFYQHWEPFAHFAIFVVIFFGEIEFYDPVEYVKFFWGSYLSSLSIVAFTNQFVDMVNILKHAFMEINEGFSKTTLEKLESSVIAVERLCTASEELNAGYGMQLLLMVGGNFLLVTINSFLIINEQATTRKLTYGLQCLIWGWAPFRLVHACTALVNQSKEFNVLLSTAMVEGRNRGLVESARLRLHLSMKKEIRFTAREFFVLDYALLISMLGAITTYLVILIQFDSSSS